MGPGWDGTSPGRELPVLAWHGTGTGMGSDLCGMGWDGTGPSWDGTGPGSRPVPASMLSKSVTNVVN